MTADLTTNYDAETNTSLAEKNKNVHEHNFEGSANAPVNVNPHTPPAGI